MLYDKDGIPVMHKDLPTAERMEASLNNIFSLVVDMQAYFLEARFWLKVVAIVFGATLGPIVIAAILIICSQI